MLKQGKAASTAPLRLQQRLTALNYVVICESRHGRAMLSDMLRSFGVRRLRVRTQAAGLDPMVDGQPDVILWDWVQPDWELLKAMSGPACGAPPAIIILEATPSPERVAMAVSAGAASVIAKPYSASVVLSHIAHAMHQRSRQLWDRSDEVLLD